MFFFFFICIFVMKATGSYVFLYNFARELVTLLGKINPFAHAAHLTAVFVIHTVFECSKAVGLYLVVSLFKQSHRKRTRGARRRRWSFVVVMRQ